MAKDNNSRKDNGFRNDLFNNVVNPVESTNNDLKKDLADVKTNVADYKDRANKRIEMLDDIDKNLSDTLNDILSDDFKVDSKDPILGKTTEEKMEYVRENSWKLKGSATAALEKKFSRFGEDKKKSEQDIRKYMEDLLKEEAQAIKDNSEILEKYKSNLLKDIETVNNLNAEIKQYDAEIASITNELTVLDTEIATKKQLVDDTENDISKEREREKEKANLILDKENEISEKEALKQDELLNGKELKGQKSQKETELKDLQKQLSDAKKMDKGGDHSELESQISDLKTDIGGLSTDISKSDAKVSGFDTTIKELNGKKTELNKDKLDISNSINRKENLLTTYNNDYKSSVEKRTEKEKEKTERLGKKASNEEKITGYDIQKRQDKYNDICSKSKTFAEDIDENNRDIKKKFRDLNIQEPQSPDINASVASSIDGDSAESGKASQSAATKANSQAVSNSPKKEYTDKQLAQNFANDVINGHHSSDTLRKQLKGYGFKTYVNALPYLDKKSRKKVLTMLKERKQEFPNLDDKDKKKIDKLLGKNTSKMLIKNGSLKEMKDLNVDELRQLKTVIDKYNNGILDFSNDDIKFLDDKVMSALSNSALVSAYDMGQIEKWRMNIGDKNREVTNLRGEILSSMKDYNLSKNEREEKAQKRGNTFSGYLGKYTNDPEEIADKKTPDILDGRSELQKQQDELTK